MTEVKLTEHELRKLHRLIHIVEDEDQCNLEKIQIGNMSIERISITCGSKNYKLNIN